MDCSINSIIGSGECFRAEKWQQLASIECANKSMQLNNSIMTLDWCGLSAFRGIEFVCCPSKKTNDNDYETSVDEQDDATLTEDDPIRDSPQSSHRRIIAMTLASRKTKDFTSLEIKHQFPRFTILKNHISITTKYPCWTRIFSILILSSSR